MLYVQRPALKQCGQRLLEVPGFAVVSLGAVKAQLDSLYDDQAAVDFAAVLGGFEEALHHGLRRFGSRTKGKMLRQMNVGVRQTGEARQLKGDRFLTAAAGPHEQHVRRIERQMESIVVGRDLQLHRVRFDGVADGWQEGGFAEELLAELGKYRLLRKFRREARQAVGGVELNDRILHLANDSGRKQGYVAGRRPHVHHITSAGSYG